MKTGNVLFVCVDKIEVRRLIWEAVKDKVTFFTDGRMSAEVLRVITACDAQSRDRYPDDIVCRRASLRRCLYRQDHHLLCQHRRWLVLSQFTKWLRHLPVEPDVQLNLLAMECSVEAC